MMTIWDNNRFKNPALMPPSGWYRSVMRSSIKLEKKGPDHVMFFHDFKHKGHDYRAGYIINTTRHCIDFAHYYKALCGRNPPLTEGGKASHLYGCMLWVKVSHEYSESLGLHYLKVQEYLPFDAEVEGHG